MPEGEGEGGHPYSVQTGMVFRLLSLKQGVQVHYLPSSPGCLLDRNRLKEFTWYQKCEMVRLQVIKKVSCLLDGEMRNFCLKVGQGLKASLVHQGYH